MAVVGGDLIWIVRFAASGGGGLGFGFCVASLGGCLNFGRALEL